MFASSFLVIVLALVGAQARQLGEDISPAALASTLARARRDAHGALTMNSDGTAGAVLKVPLATGDRNALSAIGAADLDKNLKLSAATAGLALDNVNGHGLTLTNTHQQGFGDKLTAAGTLNVYRDADNKLDVKAFATRNMPDIPHVPDFNTVGGGVDYMFKDKVGASVSAAHTDFIDRNDYSVGGKLNLFRDPTTSIDFNAGYKKFETPVIKSDWTPNFGFSLSKFW